MTAAKAPENAGKGTAEIAENRPYLKMIDQLAGQAQLDGGNSFDIASQVIDKIATATTPDEMFDAQESGPGDLADYVNIPLTVSNVRVQRSAEQYTKNGEGLGVYAVFDAETADGETLLISTGAVNVVTSLYKAQISGWLPMKCRFTAKVTANGTLYRVARP
jgi:hypothetical protein